MIGGGFIEAILIGAGHPDSKFQHHPRMRKARGTEKDKYYETVR